MNTNAKNTTLGRLNNALSMINAQGLLRNHEVVRGATAMIYRLRVVDGVVKVEGFRPLPWTEPVLDARRELVEGNLWIAATDMVFNDYSHEDGPRDRMIPLNQYFRDTRYHRFVVDINKPVFSRTIDAA